MRNNGELPKPEGEAINRNPRVFDKVQVSWDGVVRGPDLPRLKGNRWCKRTKTWWEMWRRSPQSMIMTPTDWEVMLETAFLHNMLWTAKKQVYNRTTGTTMYVGLSASEMTTLSAEVRRRVAAFGATHEDRAKLRISITSPMSEQSDEAKIKADAAKAVNYAERLAQEAADM